MLCLIRLCTICIGYFHTKPLVQDMLNVTTTKGETAKLTCKAAGNALPHIVFFKEINGSEHRVSSLTELENRTATRTDSTQNIHEFFKRYLWIHNVTSSDSGKYICKAGNSLGITTKSMYLRVLVSSPSKP